MHRFFVAPEDIELVDGERWVSIEGDDAHHIHRVLRMRTGERIVVTDGCGCDYPGEVMRVGSDLVRVRLGEPSPSAGEPCVRITLFQGLPKADRMDWVAQKAAEIGIIEVVPVPMERSVATLTSAKAASRGARWQRIARSAAQQAARGRVPLIAQPASLQDALERWRRNAPEGLLLVPWEEEHACSIGRILRSAPYADSVGIVIGPEGGMTEAEIELVRRYGGQVCTLGPRILRTETAGLVVAALVLYERGEMGG